MITAAQVNRIIQFQGDGLPVVSLYVSVEPGISQQEIHSRVTSLVDQLDPLAKDGSTEHERRFSLRADIQRIKESLSDQVWQPKAMALFSCSGNDLFEEVVLPDRVRDQIVVDEVAFVRPMLAVLDEYHRSCVVLIDKESVRAWELYQDEMPELTRLEDRLRKSDYAAGRGKDRLRHTADEQHKQHYRRVSGILDDLFRVGLYDLLIVGGHEFEVPAFLEFLSHDVRDRTAGTFSIEPTTARAAEIRAKAEAVVQQYERDEERRLVAEVLDTAAAGGLAAVGLAECLWAGSVAAIQMLLVQQGAPVRGVVCDESGWLALSGKTCPLCGKPARHTPDVVDELVHAVIDEGGAIKHVEAGTKLDDFALAAALRFSLPPEASTVT
jgi:peptide subunit release factor 1 (eRF1)